MSKNNSFLFLGLFFSFAVLAVDLPAKILFTDVTEELSFQPGTGRASWGDLDNDGWPDVVVGGRVWKNLDGRSFQCFTISAGMEAYTGPSVIADFNGDGHLDIYMIDRGGSLWLGHGDGSFSLGQAELNPAAAIQAAAAVDFDNDGWLDLYVANYEIWDKNTDYPDIMLRNQLGRLALQWTAPPEKQMRGRGVCCCDFNADGKMDIYVSNYRLMPNFLWLNQGNWSLLDKARKYNCAGSERKTAKFKNGSGIEYFSSGHSIGSLWADFNNDGFFDLFVGNFSHPPTYQDRPQLLLNGGPKKNYHFLDYSRQAAIPWQESYGSPAAADINNDGYLDIFYTTCYKGDTGRLFINQGDWPALTDSVAPGTPLFSGSPLFLDAGADCGIKSVQTVQNAFADFDNDGKMDLLTGGRLYRNMESAGHWLLLKLQGRKPNTSAIGAVVCVSAGQKKYYRQLESNTGNGNQNDLRLHFGLGNYSGTLDLEICWQDGEKTKVQTQSDQFLLLAQPLQK